MRTAGSGRPIIVVVLIASLTLAGFARRWADDDREAAGENPALPVIRSSEASPTSGRSLASMDSFALGLLLGGLRGPLVMFLWTTSENEKSAHNLDDFDTKVEWIRLLQPEFDTVHLFQIWNKAYNISVQMTNLSNKYGSILDALDYADSVNIQRPDDINIIFDVGRVYGDKLGTSHEAPYYIPRVRQETAARTPLTRVTLPSARLSEFMSAARAAGMDLPVGELNFDDQARTVAVTMETRIADSLKVAWAGPEVKFKDLSAARRGAEAAVKRDHLDPMLDAQGNVLPSLLVVTHPRPPGAPPDAYWYDGSELQFLKAYEPFPYGLPPQALSYNYYRRAQMLGLVAHESHLQTSDFVVDSRPALELKFWGAEVAEEGRRAELRLFGVDDQGDRMDLELRLPSHLDNRPDPAAGPRALESYQRAGQLYNDSKNELAAHIRRFPGKHDSFISHIEDDIGFSNLYQGDHDFLDGILNPAGRESDFDSAAMHYNLALQSLELNILHHYVEDGFMAKIYPKDPATGAARNRQSIDAVSVAERHALVHGVEVNAADYYKTAPGEMAGDRNDYLEYVHRCEVRLAMMRKAVSTQESGR